MILQRNVAKREKEGGRRLIIMVKGPRPKMIEWKRTLGLNTVSLKWPASRGKNALVQFNVSFVLRTSVLLVVLQRQCQSINWPSFYKPHSRVNCLHSTSLKAYLLPCSREQSGQLSMLQPQCPPGKLFASEIPWPACPGKSRRGWKNTTDVSVSFSADISIHRPVAANAAGYATLREIEGRLKSIRNIEKITKTMKIVASTKLNRAQRAMLESRSYGETSNTVFEKAETKPIESEDKKTLIIVCSSDKGLCGGIHSGLSRATRRMLEKKPNSDLVVLGEKSKAQLGRSSGRNIQLSFAGIGKDVPTFADAQAVADQISLLPTDYADVQILYNKFINATSYEATPIEAFSEEAIRESRNSPSSVLFTKYLSNRAFSKLRCLRD